jgi:hypothetical protein
VPITLLPTAVLMGDPMGFKDYLAILDSDLYDYAGTTKSILARIAHLIIEPNKEDPVTGKIIGDPKVDVGFCKASQEYVACQLGLSESTVRAAIRECESDKWLTTVRWRDQYGHIHNKYKWADGAWERLTARKRDKNEQREYVREKQTKMKRKHEVGRFAPRIPANTPKEGTESPASNLPGGPQANCPEADVQIALRPAGKLPVKQVGVDLDLLACSQSVMKPMGESVPEVESISEGIEKPRPSASPVSDTRVDQSLNQKQQQPQGEDFSPSPASPPHPGRDIPVNSPSARPRSAAPRTPKPICQSAGCGGPLKGNKPDGRCLRCGHVPLDKPDVGPKPRVIDSDARHCWPKSREAETVCLNRGCGSTYNEARYLREPCTGDQSQGGTTATLPQLAVTSKIS